MGIFLPQLPCTAFASGFSLLPLNVCHPLNFFQMIINFLVLMLVTRIMNFASKFSYAWQIFNFNDPFLPKAPQSSHHKRLTNIWFVIRGWVGRNLLLMKRFPLRGEIEVVGSFDRWSDIGSVNMAVLLSSLVSSNVHSKFDQRGDSWNKCVHAWVCMCERVGARERENKTNFQEKMHWNFCKRSFSLRVCQNKVFLSLVVSDDNVEMTTEEKNRLFSFFIV